jgi:hypothetical protein
MIFDHDGSSSLFGLVEISSEAERARAAMGTAMFVNRALTVTSALID